MVKMRYIIAKSLQKEYEFRFDIGIII